MTTLELFDGSSMPAFGLGTWKSKPGEVGAAIHEAIRLGYRHIDCAAVYGNEKEIGAALQQCFDEGLVTRDQLWITSKLWNDKHEPEQVGPALDQTLADLGLDHLDLYLMHWPVALRHGVWVPKTAAEMIPLEELPLATTWAAMEAQVDAGRTRYIGVSNCSQKKLAELHAGARIQPAADQVEMHAYLAQQGLVDWCREHKVVVTAYSPLGSPDRPDGMKKADEPNLLQDPAVAEVAARRGCTPGQVLIAWALARGTSVIPKSVNPKRLAENLAATEVDLATEDLLAIDRLDQHRRYVDGAFWALPDSAYTIANIWDE